MDKRSLIIAFTLQISVLTSVQLVSSWCSCSYNGVPAMFVFGDSIVDNGNNDYVDGATSRAHYYPYGEDNPLGANGRFTNNWTVADLVGMRLGLPMLPVFTNPNTTSELIGHGVNYASGGSGVLDDTNNSSKVLPLGWQIKSFKNVTLPLLRSKFGDDSKEFRSFLSRSIFVFSAGGNDIASACFENSETKITCDLPSFVEFLVVEYIKKLKEVYSLGARKFVLFLVQTTGCNPASVKKAGGKCIDSYNYSGLKFNDLLKSAIDELELDGSSFVLVNNYNITYQMIDHPAKFGLKVVNESCCELGSNGVACKVGGATCTDRNAYLYFDGGHPTNAANMVIAEKAYSSMNQFEVYPYNIQVLVNLGLDLQQPAWSSQTLIL